VEPYDVRIVCQSNGPTILRLHHGVIEVLNSRHGQQARLHVDLVRTDMWGPDKKGRCGLQFIPIGGTQNDGTGSNVLEDQLPLLHQFAAAVDAARTAPPA
jgi:hypothetical protein